MGDKGVGVLEETEGVTWVANVQSILVRCQRLWHWRTIPRSLISVSRRKHFSRSRTYMESSKVSPLARLGLAMGGLQRSTDAMLRGKNPGKRGFLLPVTTLPWFFQDPKMGVGNQVVYVPSHLQHPRKPLPLGASHGTSC